MKGTLHSPFPQEGRAHPGLWDANVGLGVGGARASPCLALEPQYPLGSISQARELRDRPHVS